MKYLIWILFMYSSLCAQDLVGKRNSISLQIGEPSSIRFQHALKRYPKLNLGIGIGMHGLFLQPDYSKKFSYERGYIFYHRSNINILDLYLRRYFHATTQRRIGVIIDVGIENRVTFNMSFINLAPLIHFTHPKFFFVEPIPYFRLGFFCLLGSQKQFELNIQYGLGVNVLFVTGYIEQMRGIGLGYRFSRATGNKNKKE